MPGKAVPGHAVKAYRQSRVIPPLFLCLFVFLFGPDSPPPPTGPGPPYSQGLYITHSDAPQSVGLLWTSDRLVADISTWQHTTLTQTSMPPVGFEPTISAGERPQTYALDGAAAGIGPLILYSGFIWKRVVRFTPRLLYPREKNLSMLWIAGWAGHTAGLNVLEKWKLSCTFPESNPRPRSPRAGHYTDWAVANPAGFQSRLYLSSYLLT